MGHRNGQERNAVERAVGRAWARRAFVLLALVVVVGGTAAGAGAAVETPPPPSIWSDQADYAPGEAVTLTGRDWAPGEVVRIVVNDDGGQTWRRDVDVTADADGTISDSFTLPDWFVALYSVTATGPVSGTATTSFSDGNVDFQLATVGQSAPANVSWTVTWNHWQGTGNTPDNTCAGTPDVTGGTTSYNGNALASGSARPSVNGNASAQPTGAQTTGANAGLFVLDYWTASATDGAGSALTGSQLCTAGQSGGQTIRTLYAHFKVADSSAPTTTASATVTGGGTYTAGSWTSKNVTVSLSATDNAGGTGVKEIHYSLNGAAETVVSGASASVAVSAEGTTTIGYFARDNAGNTETAHSFVVKIDKTAPLVTVSPDRAPDANGWYVDPVTFTAAETDALSGPGDCDAPVTYTGPDSATASVELTCRDAAGNEGTGSAGFQFDSTPLASSASSAELDRDGQIDVGYSVPSAGSDVSGLASVELWVQGPADASFHPAPNPDATVATGSFAYVVDEGDGSYRFYVIATDGAGNAEAPPVAPSTRITATLEDTAAPSTSDDGDGQWHNYDVTVHLTAEDAGSGVDTTYVSVDGGSYAEGTQATVTAESDHSNDGVHTVSYYSVDKAGNEEGAHTVGVKIDTVAPAIVDAGHSPSDPDGDNGWYRQAVVTTFEASDEGSGLDAACAAAFPAEDGHDVQHVSTGSEQGSAVSVDSSSCADAAGNVGAGTTSGSYAIDFTPPTITLASRLPAANANGWNNEDVTATWDCADQDGLSGVVAEHVSHTFTDEGADQSAGATCADEAGNEASDTVNGVSIDETKPVVTGSRSPQANADGWNDENVDVEFDCADTGAVRSGIDTDTVAGETLTSEGADQTVFSSGDCVDKAGNEAEQASLGHISIDKTAPTITLASRLPAANANGWNKTNVTVTWDCADGLSGVPHASTSDTRTAEAAGQTAHGSCADRAGNESSDSLAGISIDKTAPTIDIAAPVDGGSYAWTTPVAASYSCSDGLSGPDGCSGPVPNGTNFVGLPAGGKSFTVGASDRAGNTASKTNAYTVAYVFNGFFQPIDMGAGILNVAKSGSSIPVKFKLGGNAGLDVFAPGYPASVAMSCSATASTDAIESTTTANNGLTYDATADQYVYVWKTSSAWAGTCRQFRAVFADGRTVTANFKFAK